MDMVDPKKAVDAARDTAKDMTDRAETTVRDTATEADRRVRELGQYIRDQREQAKLSGRNLAKRAGVSNPYLSQIERGLRKPSAEILQSIASALRISAETLYVKAGILEERSTDVTAAVMADPDLTEPQRRALLEIYRSFVPEPSPAEVADDDAPAESADATATGS